MPRCQPASPASPKGKYVKVSLDGKRQLKLKLRSKPGAHGEKFRGVEKTTAGNFQAFVHKKGMKVGVRTFDTEEAAATRTSTLLSGHQLNGNTSKFGKKSFRYKTVQNCTKLILLEDAPHLCSLNLGSTSPRAHMVEVLPTETHPHAQF